MIGNLEKFGQAVVGLLLDEPVPEPCLGVMIGIAVGFLLESGKSPEQAREMVNAAITGAIDGHKLNRGAQCPTA